MQFLVRPTALDLLVRFSALKRETGMPFQLTKQERDRLIRMLRRAHALIDLDEGSSPELVAQRYQVARSTIYNWIKGYQLRGLNHPGVRELPRPGRPRAVRRSSD